MCVERENGTGASNALARAQWVCVREREKRTDSSQDGHCGCVEYLPADSFSFVERKDCRN